MQGDILDKIIVIIWMVLAFVSGFLFRWALKWKKRKLTKWAIYKKLGTFVLCFLAGLLVYYFLDGDINLVWVSRLVLLGIGAFHLFLTYLQSWSVRDHFVYANDSFAVEFLYTAVLAFAGASIFAFAPRILGDDSASGWVVLIWDAPVLILLPFFILKLSDFSSQVPFRIIKNTWVFPIEPLVLENMQQAQETPVTFQVAGSLKNEYRWFARQYKPFIVYDFPIEKVSLGYLFRLVIQERRKKPNLPRILDMGDEYGGSPQFWWLFSIKRIWWNPLTWFRNPRYLNPDLSLLENQVKKYDVILARRIPAAGTMGEGARYDTQITELDPEKTVLIHKD